jgi:hypothetical protein
MGKKGNKGKKEGIGKNQDVIKRMNFLLQASQVALLSGNKPLSDFYTLNLTKIASKNVIRM